MRYSTPSLLAAVLAPLAVSAVPVRRGTDPATLQVLREYLPFCRAFDQSRRWIPDD